MLTVTPFFVSALLAQLWFTSGISNVTIVGEDNANKFTVLCRVNSNNKSREAAHNASLSDRQNYFLFTTIRWFDLGVALDQATVNIGKVANT